MQEKDMKVINLLELLNLSKIKVSDENKLEKIKEDGSLSVKQLAELFRGEAQKAMFFLREYFKKYRNEMIKEDEFIFLDFFDYLMSERGLGARKREDYPSSYDHDSMCIQEMCFQYSEYLLKKYGDSITKVEYYTIRRELIDCYCDWQKSKMVVDYSKKYETSEYALESPKGFFNGFNDEDKNNKENRKALYINKKDFLDVPLELGDILVINERKYTVLSVGTLNVSYYKDVEDTYRQMPFLFNSKSTHDSLFAAAYVKKFNIPDDSKDYYYLRLYCFED